MTETQKAVFKAVYDNRSLSRAANSLYVSQPAISRHLARLEEEVGVTLFVRGTGGVEPTQAAELFHGYLQDQELRYRAVLEKMLDIGRPGPGRLRLGCPEIWNPSHLNRRMEGFPEKNQVSIEAFRLSELLLNLQSGKLDMALSHAFYTPAIPGLVSVKVDDTGCGILYSPERFGQVSDPSDFSGTPFMVYDSDMEKRFAPVIERACADYSLQPTIRSCAQLTTALFETAMGKSIMLFSDWDSAVDNAGFGYCRLERPLPLHLYFFSDRLSQTGRNLVAFLTGRK